MPPIRHDHRQSRQPRIEFCRVAGWRLCGLQPHLDLEALAAKIARVRDRHAPNQFRDAGERILDLAIGRIGDRAQGGQRRSRAS